MASYDKQKLLALLERRRAAVLVAQDLNVRYRDAKDDMNSALSRIRSGSDRYRLPSGHLERLLNLPTNEALALTADGVQSYADGPGTDASRYSTGIDFSTYRNYIKARDLTNRLTEQLRIAKENLEQFAITSHLIDAVREWGFIDPQLEM